MITKQRRLSRVAPANQVKAETPAQRASYGIRTAPVGKSNTDRPAGRTSRVALCRNMEGPFYVLVGGFTTLTGDKMRCNVVTSLVPGTCLSATETTQLLTYLPILVLCQQSSIYYFYIPQRAGLLKTASIKIIPRHWLSSFEQMIHAVCFFSEPPSWVRQRPVSHSFAPAGAKQKREETFVTRNPSHSLKKKGKGRETPNFRHA